MATSLQTPVPSAGTATTGRALAPDLARGGMLLAIAFAHAPLFVTNVDRGPAWLNDFITSFHMLFVNNHARPMFAFLFGYALVQLMNRQLAKGNDWVPTRKLLRRRGFWLIAIGFVHLAILVPIDILAAYGLSAVLLVGFLRAKDSTLLWVAGVALVPATFSVGWITWFALNEGASTYAKGSVAAGSAGFVELFVSRVMVFPPSLIAGVILVIPGVLLGMWAARRRVLDEPERHRSFLVRATIVTGAVSLAGSLPLVLVDLGIWSPTGIALWVVAFVQPLTGYFGGMALAGAIALVAIAAARRQGRLTTAIQALGQRSMSLYLFQSVVYVAVFFPYGLGLQDDLGMAGATGVALATWVASILLAELMRKANYRGPAEILLRRLAYRDRRTVAK
ncbi:DUF418 domain-containing protein [Tenggerimyces flavus]|uniref:DUF418 domain-containing protein n=1 Tax=Tenggerimyces flavus TaxID=1708749 RepID=A0ABV7YB01_9ACTN|nr:DUF418 domain-containing protein [Tenggerimyces flavus]MBM7785286.1 putative membrane protein YeiB [Tenggerimyces flavus]